MLGLSTHELDFSIIREVVVQQTDKKCDICGKVFNFIWEDGEKEGEGRWREGRRMKEEDICLNIIDLNSPYSGRTSIY